MVSDSQPKFIDQMLKETFEISSDKGSVIQFEEKFEHPRIYFLETFTNFIRLKSNSLTLDFPINWGPIAALESSNPNSLLVINQKSDEWKLSEIFPIVDLSGGSWVMVKKSNSYFILVSDSNKWTPSWSQIDQLLEDSKAA